MSQEIQTYTPTVHPLNYDALASREGCEPQTEIDVLLSRGFNNLCVFSHDSSNFRFAQSDLVSYQVGPYAQDIAGEQKITWSAWVGVTGIRLGKVGIVYPPAMQLGSPSSLFPATRTSKVTHCFDYAGTLHVAIQKAAPNFIELKNGTVDLTFAGISPLLFNLNNISPGAGVVCYYLRNDLPFTLLARFSQESFATEHFAISQARVNLTRLISIRALGNLVKLYATDEQGRDVTLTSPNYSLLGSDKATNSLAFVSGRMLTAISPSSNQSDKGKVGVGFVKGVMTDATAETVAIPGEKGTVGVSFNSGEMNAA